MDQRCARLWGARPGCVRIACMKIEDMPAAFEAYYRTFPAEAMNDLKLDHTRRVVENAQLIMAGGDFPEELREDGAIAAWLHDLGRFSQFQHYHTFSDRQSVNHALLSCGEALRLGWLDDRSPTSRNRILGAIAFHNLRELPPHLSEAELRLAHLVRDADKLDIFTVLDQAIETNYLPSHPEVYWGLPFTAPPSERIVSAIEQGISVDYADIKSFADFVFVQLAWCNGGLYFATSRRLALERREVEQRGAYLCELLPEHVSTIRRVCDCAKAALEQGCHGA